MPRYEGKYGPLREHPFCNVCGTEGKKLERATTATTLTSSPSSPSSPSSSLLKRCSRCKMVWYCSADCQKRDFAAHKRNCRDIATSQAATDAAYEPLKSLFDPEEEGRPAIVPVDDARGYALGREVMLYVRTRSTLCLKQTSVAKQVQTRDAWAVILDHHMDMLTLMSGANVGLQMSTPFLMLRLNQDDSAYCFCRHALGVDWPDSDPNFTTGTVRSNVNYRYRDVMVDFGGEQGLNRFLEISVLVALAVIKMRLVAMFESVLEEVDAFAATSASHILGPDGQAEVRQYLVGDEDNLADQRRQLIILLDVVQARNASMVPALLHPEPLLRVPTVSEPPPGTPEEARLVLNLALSVWLDIPGSDRFLQARFGTATPSYPT